MNNSSTPQFVNTVLFVRDINLSKCFYANILGQTIKDDFGRYVGFENGIGIWQGEYALETIYSKKKVMMTYGNSTQPGSSHYGDQLDLFLKREFRTAWRTRQEIEANLEYIDSFSTHQIEH